MKNLFLVILLSLFASISFADIGPVGRSFQQDSKGTAVSGSIEKWYIYVKNTSGGGVSDGWLMVQETTEDDGYSSTTSTSAGAQPLCIIAKADASDCADDENCRCQTYGINTGVVFDVTNDAASAGDKGYVSENTAGQIQSEAFGSVVATDIPVGVFLDDESASADVDFMILLK